MSIATELLKADHIGIRELKEHLSKEGLEKFLVITDRGRPISVNLPYEDVMELVDILDELNDINTLEIVKEGREAIRACHKGVPVQKLFKKLKGK